MEHNSFSYVITQGLNQYPLKKQILSILHSNFVLESNSYES